MENEKIDAVIAWVDGSDEKWQKEKSKYKPETDSKESDNPARYRSWDNFNLLLRSILTNLPWLNKIYIVTAGQTPSWYKENDKVKIVFHEEFIPKEYLPTFNANPIELNIHRIKGISEQFIYFNDDMFIMKKMKPTDFFINGKPCDCGILHVHCVQKSRMIQQIANNSVAIINDHFDMKETLKNKKNWFNSKYGIRYNLENLIFSKCPRFPGFKHFHLPAPYLKSTYETVWNEEFEELDKTCKLKFREEIQLNQWLIQNWQLASNNFIPVKAKNRGLLIDFEKNSELEELEKCKNAIRKTTDSMLCINDGDDIQNFDKIKEEVNEELEKEFPNKVICEK